MLKLKVAAITVLLVLSVTVIIFTKNIKEGSDVSSGSEVQLNDDQLTPGEWGFRQRAYPNGEINRKAFSEAMAFLQSKKDALYELGKYGMEVNEWEFCGPTNIGGRVTDIEVANNYVYVAAASGGIFRTINNGGYWESIFDDAASLSIGDMAVAPSDPMIIYAGTGEPNAGGGSLTYDGNGVYKTTDGGDSWHHKGPENIGSIGRMVVSAENPDVCYVGAMGYLFENNPERGVYRTRDGGETWENVLHINDSTGIIDMAINPVSPDTVYAAAWQRVRRPNRRSYGGPSSGIYRSIDGGDTWSELTNGLPNTAGRIGITVSKSNPEILYAFYTDANTANVEGIYKTTDYGESWFPVNSSGVTSVPYMWWFGKIEVSPVNPDHVYLIGFVMEKSTNGGNTWNMVFPSAHVDQHTVWIDPANQSKVIIGHDGGVHLSYNGGTSGTKLNGLPVTQFYTCEMDYSHPERLYGGTQDNSSMRTMTGNVDDWEIIFSGDGFKTLVDPLDNSYVYTESQYGNFVRSTNGGNTFMPAMSGIGFSDRFNWNTPVVFDPNNPEILYLGSNKLYKTVNRAVSWTPVSQDLTKNNPQLNLTYGTITTISVSPLNGDVIYVGTDDGNVQVTTNGGLEWSLITSTLPNRWVTSVLADPDDVNGAYVTLSGYRHGTNTGHIYKTTDQGETWVDISGDLPDMPVNELLKVAATGVLYIATDIGVFCSVNEGLTWDLLGENLPALVVNDICYHDLENILVAGTFGRGMFRITPDHYVGYEELTEIPVLNANVFPNPCESQTMLTLDIPQQDHYNILLFDQSGRMVNMVFDGQLYMGSTSVSIDMEGIPSGMYVVLIISEKGKLQQKVKIVKE